MLTPSRFHQILILALFFSGCGGGGTESPPIEEGLKGPDQITYPFAVLLAVSAPENNAKEMLVTLFGTIAAGVGGEVSGEAVLIYEYMEPCGWQPPHPENGPPPYCLLTGVTDGRFPLSGRVLETVRRGQGDPREGAIFGYLDVLGVKADEAPAEMELRFEIGTVPAEHMDLWGTSGPKQAASTGAAALGLDGAGIFEPFEVAPILQDPSRQATALELTGTHTFQGTYQGGTPVHGYGGFRFVRSLEGFPAATEPEVYLSHATALEQDPSAAPAVVDGPTWDEIQQWAQEEQGIRDLLVLTSQIEVESEPLDWMGLAQDLHDVLDRPRPWSRP